MSGRVQAVFFRYETREKALALGLAGWVRNLADGRVEAAFEGPKDAVETMVAWCREGPAGARVDTVDVRSTQPEGLTSFEIRS